jgi:MFS family permease
MVASAAPAVVPARWMLRIFLAFAFTYFFSALLRAVTATLAPAFSHELGLGAADLGLLAGAYFLGFAAMQLPLGLALDRWGPRRVSLGLLGLAVLGCAGFALAGGLASLAMARALIGIGVSAALMAPLTFYRWHFSPAAQMRANAWMLMTGSLGMLASTLPVQWLLPLWGWRGLFWAVAALLLLAMVLLFVVLPADAAPAPSVPSQQAAAPHTGAAPDVLQARAGTGYGRILRHPLFVRLVPMAFFSYGGMIAVQALWAGPWLTQVAGQSADQAARGLFIINLSMLLAFLAWGLCMPGLVRRGWHADRLMRWGLPLHLGLLAWNLWLGPAAGAWHWAAFCVSCTFTSLSQPAVGQAFPPALAGRALSAFNLVIFAGVFCVQWGLGLLVDGFLQLLGQPWPAYRAAFAVWGLLAGVSYVWLLWAPVRRLGLQTCP